MRILHFSDFHLRSKEAGKRSLDILERMLDAIKDIKQKKPIDMVVFSGDLVDKAGFGFDCTYEEALQRFRTEVIDRIVVATDIPAYKFLLVGGNHEIVRNLVEKDEHKAQISLSTEQQLEDYMSLADINDKVKCMKTFIDFQREYYASVVDQDKCEYEEGQFHCTLKFDVDGGYKVGVSLLNSAWMCYDDTDEKHIAMGVKQLNTSWPKFKDCISIAVAHHHPTFLASYDQIEVTNVLLNHFDFYLCGHTHGMKSQYIEQAGGSYFESIASGNLYNNIHEIDPRYCNGFTVIDYSIEDKSVEVTPYRQLQDESFGLDYNYGNNHDGTWYFYRKQYNVFKSLEVWLNDFDIKYPIIGEDVLKPIREKLLDPNNRRIVLTALSGMGKTRLLYDAFNGSRCPNAFYAEYNSVNGESLLKELDERLSNGSLNNGLVIIDNCTSELYKAIKNKNFGSTKYICVNNEYYDLEDVYTPDLIKLDPDDMRAAVAQYIDTHLPLTNDNTIVCDEIKRIADGYPFMAHELLKSYHEGNKVTISTADELVPKLLKYQAGKAEDQEAAMILLSLFQPFALSKVNKDAYDFVINNEVLFGIEGSYISKQKKLTEAINRYTPTLIEKTDKFVNVRPFPLAIWLMGKWFERMNNDLVDILLRDFEQLKAQNESAYKLLSGSLSRRIDYMRHNPLAHRIITSFNSGPQAPFANEKVVRSELGSQLFLAMSVVNPVAVSECLNRVLQSKSIEWIKENITGDIRRNLVLTLEKLCFCRDSYDISSILFAKFALAENETWGNNATGQFLQLFHILLPGTEASLDQRFRTLSILNEHGGVFIPMLIRALDSSFVSSGFVRMGGAEKFGDEKLEDYAPSHQEVWNYWYSCRDLLLLIAENHKEYITEVSAIIERHSYHWLLDGYYDSIFKPLVDVIFSFNDRYWPKLYNDLKRYVERRDLNRYPQEKKDEISAYIQSIRPDTFITRLYDAQQEYYNKDRKTPEKFMEIMQELFFPLAQAFVDEHVFEKEKELKLLITDNGYIDFVFTKEVIKLLSDDELSVMLEHIWSYIVVNVADFHSPFVIKLCFEGRDRKPIIAFLDKLYSEGYHKLYISLASRCEYHGLYWYEHLSGLDKKGLLKVDFLSLYLSGISEIDADWIIQFLKRAPKDYPDRMKDIVEGIMRFRFFMRDEDPDELKSLIKECLLLYPIDNEQPSVNVDYSRFVVDILEKEHDENFAIAMNKKIIEGFNQSYLHGNFEGICSVLLKKYQIAIWDDFRNAFVSDDYIDFYLQVFHEIGSGFNFGVGPLFQGDNELVKKMCIDYPNNVPEKLASMVPVFSKSVSEVEEYSDMFLWLLDNFGDNEHVLSGLHANIHSFSWTGSPIGLFRSHINCLKKLLTHKRASVRSWAQSCISEFEAEIKREQDDNDFMRMHYGH